MLIHLSNHPYLGLIYNNSNLKQFVYSARTTFKISLGQIFLSKSITLYYHMILCNKNVGLQISREGSQSTVIHSDISSEIKLDIHRLDQSLLTKSLN